MSWYNPVTWFADSANTAAGNQAARDLATLNARDYGAGGQIYEKIAATDGTAAADDALGQVMAQGAGQITDADKEVTEAFVEGWNEAVDQRKGQFNSAVGGVFNLVPATVWIALVVMLFFYLGGPALLKGRLAK